MPVDLFENSAAVGPQDLFAGNPPVESAPGAILRQLKAGTVVELPQMAGQALQYLSKPGNTLYNAGKSLADSAKERGKLPENAPIDEAQHGTVVNALAGGARMIPQSIVPAAVVGAGLASLPVSLPAGATLLGAAALGSLPAAMSQGQQTLDKAHEAGVPEEEAIKAARLTALVEGAGETIGTAAMGKVLGVGAKALGAAKTPGDMLKGLVKPEVLKPWAKATAKAYPTEIVTEMGQNAGETAVENAYGIEKKQTPWEAAKDAIAPTAGMTTLLAPFGLAGHKMAARHTQQQAEALSSPDTAPEVRAQLAQGVYADMAKLDPEVAAVFASNANAAIDGNLAFALDESALRRDTAGSDAANADFTAAGDAYAAPLQLENKPTIVPTQTGGAVALDPADGPLTRAAIAGVTSGASQQAQNPNDPGLLHPFQNLAAAQGYVQSQADPEMYDVISHPRVKGTHAVVQKSGAALQELQTQRRAGSANQAALVRDEQLKQEEGDTYVPPELTSKVKILSAPNFTDEKLKDLQDTHEDPNVRQAAEIVQAQRKADLARKEEAAKAKAPTKKAAPAADTTVADAAQDELAPKPVQPVSSMPAAQQRAKARASEVLSSNQTRTEQLASEETPETIDRHAQAANTAPTEGQKEAGNYQHGHITVGGLNISVETPAGATRSGTDGTRRWSVKNTAHYGYLKRTVGADSENVDVYVKPGTPTNHQGPVFVVDQYNPATGEFDEHKSLVGYGSQAEAAKAYDAHFNDKSGPKRRGAVTSMSLGAFKTWLKNGDTAKPVSAFKFNGEASDSAQAAQNEIAQSTGAKFSQPRLARLPGETDAAYLQRRADLANSARTGRVAQQKAPTKPGDQAAVRKALDLPADAEVSILTPETRPDAGKAKGVSKQAAQFIVQVARIFGKRVVFFDVADRGAAEGFYTQGNTIYLNVNSSTQHLRVLGHELTHAMKKQAGDAYAKMLDAGATLRTDEEMAAQFKDLFHKDMDAGLLDQAHPNGGTWREFLAEEWMSDLGGNRFAESKFWTEMFAQLEKQHGTERAKGIVGRLRQALVTALHKLKALIGGNAFAVDARLAEHLDEIRTAVATGFAEYARLSKAGQLSEVVGEGTKFSQGSSPAKATQTAFVEAVPSEQTRADKAVGALDAAQKSAFTEHVFGKVDPSKVARWVLGRPDVRVEVLNSTGGYQPDGSPSGKISPNVLVQVTPTGKRAVTLDGAVQVAQALNYVYTQDGVPVSRYDDTLRQQPESDTIKAVVRFTLLGLEEGHAISTREAAFYKHLEKVYGIGVGYSKIDGKIVVGNYAGLATDEFHRLAGETARKAGIDFEFTAAEGKYVFHDWQADDHGIGHEVWRQADTAGRPNLQARLHGWRDSAVSAAAGWLDERGIKYSPGRYDDTAGRRYVGHESGVADSESGGSVHRRIESQGRVDLAGVHFSKEPRQHLSGVYFGIGSGAKAQEVERVMAASDERIKSRIYAYVNEGKGVFPEDDVGRHAHVVKFDNLYDIAADPLDVRLRYLQDKNAMESAILDAGFDGYYLKNAFGNQGVAILVGAAATRGVTPEYKGTEYRGKDQETPPAGEASDFGKQQQAVVANRALPDGEMPGARWKRVMKAVMPDIDVSHLDDATKYYKNEIVKRPTKLSPARLEMQWESQTTNEVGPVYHGKGFDLRAVRKLDTETDFPEHEALQLGHAAFVRDPAYRFAILDQEGRPAGFLDAEVNGLDEINAIHDMAIDKPGEGLGAKVVETIMASTYDGVRVIEVLPQSERFWDRLGAGSYDPYKNTTLDFEGSPAEARFRNAGGARLRGATETQGGGARFSPSRESLPESTPAPRALDSAGLRALRRAAAGLEHPQTGIFLHVTDDGKAVATGPKGARIPDTFRRFAHENGLTFYAQRLLPKYDAETLAKPSTDKQVGKPLDGLPNSGSLSVSGLGARSQPMPIAYRESGAHYFGEMDHTTEGLNRTDKTRFSQARINVDGVDRPTTNSEGQPIHLTEAGIVNFWRWFEGSKVVDDQGRPLVVYHSTLDDKVQFDKRGKFMGYAGVSGISVTDNREMASRYLDRYADSGWVDGKPDQPFSKNVMPLYVVAKNPLYSNERVKTNLPLGAPLPENYTSEVERRGYDALIRDDSINLKGASVKHSGAKNAVRGREIIVFSPEQVKSAIGNTGAFSPKNAGIRYSTPRFVSQLSRTIENAPAKMQTQPAVQWRLWLAGQQSVKKDELTWSGVLDWLDMQKREKVSRQQIQDYLAHNGVRVEDVVLGRKDPVLEPKLVSEDEVKVTSENENQWRLTAPNGDFVKVGKGTVNEGSAAAYGLRHFNGQIHERNKEKQLNADTSRFSKYVLPKGKDYRELLITLPSNVPNVQSTIDLERDMQQAYEAANYDEIRRLDGQRRATQEMRKTLPAFRSSHFDQPNILAHLRFNERIDADGNKVLFLEELQSDWGQQGKQKGFGAVEVARNTGENKASHPWRVGTNLFASEQNARDHADELTRKRVPAGPFVTDTKAWTALALKRAVMWAVQHGFSKVAWTTGEQQAVRYDLSKQVDRVEYEPAGEGLFEVNVWDKNGNDVFSEDEIGIERIEEVLGKEIAKKVAAGEGDRSEGGYRDWRTLSGLDLKVGGEGMHAYYDAIVPQVANDLLRKVGGGKVETVEVAKNGREGKSVRPQDREGMKGRGEILDQLGFTITPEMAAKVGGEGLPLFSLRRALNGEHNTNDHLVPETPLYLNDPNLVDLAHVNGKPIRLNVGEDNGAGHGRGALHIIANAGRSQSRALEQVTDDEGENVVRSVIAALSRGSAMLHSQGSGRHALRLPMAGKTLILGDLGDHYTVVTVLPSAENKWGNSDWTGRLTFPVPADATSADPAHFTSANSSLAGTPGQGYVSEKFHTKPSTPLAQPSAPAKAPIVVKVAQKRHRTLDTAAMARDGLDVKKSPANDNQETVPATTYSPKRVAPELLSRVDLADFGWNEQDDEYAYHVTSEPAAKAALKSGLAPGKRSMFPSSYASNVKGRVFFTERSGVKFWEGRIEDALFDQHDDPPPVGVLRALKSELTLLPDEVGTQDAKHDASYVQFSPARATLGALTPAQEAAANNVLGAPKTLRQRLAGFKKDWAKNLKQGIFDQFAPIAELDQTAYIQARLSKGGDSSLEALMLYGKLFVGADGATDVHYTKAGGTQGFAGKMAALKGEHDRFLLWVAAQRADRLKGLGLENLWSDTDIAELKTLNQGDMKDGTTRPMIYLHALKDMNEFNDNVLEVAVSSGLIDDATRQMYKDTPYVPFYRLQEDDTVSGFGISPGMVNQYAWKRLKGGTEKLNEDLMANLLHNWSHLITASAKNRAAKATLDAAERTGVAAQIPSGAPGRGHVSYKETGREKVFVVSDPHLMDAVAALHYSGLGPWAKPLSAAKHWLTVGVTANPAFKLRNLIRDSIQSVSSADMSYNLAGNIAQGWRATAEDSETRAHMLASGGMIRFGSMLDGKDSQRAKDLIHQGVDPDMILDSDGKIKQFWKRYAHPALEAYKEFGDRTEQVNRAALYEQLIAKGMTHAEAAFWARDLMDFSMSGKWTAIRTLTQTVPFFNARLQGLYKLGRAGKDDIRRLGTVLGATTLASLALLMAYEDDDDWKKRSDSDRNNYWWFKVGDHAFRLPKPFEIGAIATLAERSYELTFNQEMTGNRYGKNLRDLVMSQLSMNPVPQLFKPMMDIYANKDSFTGRDIESMADQKRMKQDRYDEKTSEVARFLGGLGLPDPTQLAMGRYDTLSPKQFDFVARGYFSWLATMTTTALDYGIRPMLERGARPDLQLHDVFLAGNFVESLPSNSSRYLTQMYDQAREIEQAYASYHHLLKLGDKAGAKVVLDDNRENIIRYRSTENMKRRESLMNQQLQRISASTTPSGEEKRARLDQVYARRNQLAEQFRAN